MSLNHIDIRMDIPASLEQTLKDLITVEARKLISENTAFMKEMLAHVLIDNRKTIVELLKPVIKELFDDKGFSVKVHGWWDDEREGEQP